MCDAISKTTDETEVLDGCKSSSSTVIGSEVSEGGIVLLWLVLHPRGRKGKDMNKMSTTKLKTKMTIEEKDLIQPKEIKERESSTSLSVATFLHVWKVTHPVMTNMVICYYSATAAWTIGVEPFADTNFMYLRSVWLSFDILTLITGVCTVKLECLCIFGC